MVKFLRKNVVAPIATASILGSGVTAVWVLAWFMVYTVLERSVKLPNVDPSAVLTFLLLSPVFLAAVPMFKDPAPQNADAYLTLLRDNFFGSYLVLGILCLPLAIWCYLHHRRYSHGAAIIWAIYVMVMGVPGAIGYWLHRSWSPTERCSGCGVDAPRDRDACYQCGMAFPIPSPKGIEMQDSRSDLSFDREVLTC